MQKYYPNSQKKLITDIANRIVDISTFRKIAVAL